MSTTTTFAIAMLVALVAIAFVVLPFVSWHNAVLMLFIVLILAIVALRTISKSRNQVQYR